MAGRGWGRGRGRRTLPGAGVGLLLLVLVLLDSAAAITLPAFSGLRRDNAPYKGFSGLRLRDDSARKVFFHDQTVAVVEVAYDSMDLLNCELIEVNKASLAREALQNLSSIARPNMLSFADMNGLMRRCHELDKGRIEAGARARAGATPASKRAIGNADPTSLLSGILPGTKWCGTGDIARNYFDLGPEEDIDRCCRTHDLCPVKVRPFQPRYGLSNMSFYTKSHCDCDDMLLQCLKKSGRPTANIMGNIYFNLLRVPCVEDVENRNKDTRRYRRPKTY